MEEATRPKRILIVDDDSRIIHFLRLKLKLGGYDVVSAADGCEGLKLVESANPDVLVLDLMMTVMDGFEVLRRLRAYSDLPVIVLTANAEALAEARKLGADDFITKPFNPDELAKRISDILDRKK